MGTLVVKGLTITIWHIKLIKKTLHKDLYRGPSEKVVGEVLL